MEPKTHILPFGKYTAYENYIIGEPNEFVNMGIEEACVVVDQIAYKYKGNWGYIGNRVNRNSVDPMVYLFAKREYPNFYAMAVVTYSQHAEEFVFIEKSVADFVNLNFESFRKLNASIAWMKEKLNTNKRSETVV